MGSFTISFFQISDVHWNWSPSQAEGEPESQSMKSRFHVFWNRSRLTDPGLLERFKGDKNILVLGGDNVLQGKYEDRFSSFAEHILSPLYNLKLEGRPYFDQIIAVPGNHDIKRTPFSPNTKGGAVEAKGKFGAFTESFVGHHKKTDCSIPLHIPLPKPVAIDVGVEWEGKNHVIQLVGVNSAEICGYLDRLSRENLELKHELLGILGKPKDQVSKDRIAALRRQLDAKAEYHDPGYIDEALLDNLCQELQRGEKPVLARVAIIHHNSLPFHNDDDLKLKFWNANAFNRLMLQNRFRLVLHGHQHVGDACFFHKTGISGQRTRSYLAEGFLSVGAPAFDFVPSSQLHRGFNIVQMRFENGNNVCECKVHQFLWQENEKQFTERHDAFDLATQSIPEEDRDRWTVLPKLNRLLYSEDSIKGVVRALDDPQLPPAHSQTLRHRVDEYRELRASYALSVFPPSLWLNSKLMEFCLPFGVKTIERAARRAQVLRAENRMIPDGASVFSFSKPLYKAIQLARATARSMPLSDVGSRLQSSVLSNQGASFVRTAITRGHGAPTSFSVWGGKNCCELGDFALKGASAGEIGLRMIERLSDRPFVRYDKRGAGSQRLANEQLCEYPRIVTWSREDFCRPSALDIIEFHEAVGLPLFWLNPDALKDENGASRGRVGYISLIASATMSGVELGMADVVCHLSNARRIENPDEFWAHAWGGSKPKMHSDFRLNTGIDYDLNERSHPLHEFLVLLTRPDIIFAADAWACANAGAESWVWLCNSLDIRTS